MSDEELDFSDAQMLRKIAEEQLKAKHTKNAQPDIEVDVKKLMHELQVHQIELEMQNEELREAYEKAETALKKYTMLYDLAPIGYFTLDSEGCINDLNFTGADLLGERRFSLTNVNFKLFVAQESLIRFDEFFKKVFKSNSKETCEVKLGNDKVPPFVVYIEAIVTGEERKCLLSVLDISSFKK